MRNVLKTLVCFVAVIMLGSPLSMAMASEQCSKSDKRTNYFLLDSRIIESAQNAKLTIGEAKKHPANPLFVEDTPWEPRFDNVYANVIYDEEDKLYKCWYSPFIIDERTTLTPEDKRHPFYTAYLEKDPDGREMGICYATSKDGLKWDKPELGLVEFEGNKNNNILMRGPHGAAVFKDIHESDPAKRYKMIFKRHGEDAPMAVSFSADGLRWSEPIDCPEIDAHGDTHNVAFWAPDMGKYIVFTRINAGDNVRQVATTESKDFVNWTKAKVVLRGDDPLKQTHDLVVFPTGGVYIGLLGVMEFIERSNYNVKQHIELAWSPDTVTWYRIEEGKPFIDNSPAEKEHYGYTPYDWGTVFASAPIFLGNEIRIYYGACDWYFMDWRKGCLALATLRPDGWAGYEAQSQSGMVLTKSIPYNGGNIFINADLNEGGHLNVRVLDKDGKLIAKSKTISASLTNYDVQFDRKIQKGTIKLQFEFANATLYSFDIGK